MKSHGFAVTALGVMWTWFFRNCPGRTGSFLVLFGILVILWGAFTYFEGIKNEIVRALSGAPPDESD